MSVHPLACVDPQAELGADVQIGPFSVVEAGVRIGDGCVLESRVVVKRGTRLGANNHVFEGAVLGGLPQHVHMPEQARPGADRLGQHDPRERDRSIGPWSRTTSRPIGDHCLLMANAHVAHDCSVGDHVILTNNAMLAGHVSVGPRAFLSGGGGRAPVLPHRLAGDGRRPGPHRQGRAALCDHRRAEQLRGGAEPGGPAAGRLRPASDPATEGRLSRDLPQRPDVGRDPRHAAGRSSAKAWPPSSTPSCPPRRGESPPSGACRPAQPSSCTPPKSAPQMMHKAG